MQLFSASNYFYLSEYVARESSKESLHHCVLPSFLRFLIFTYRDSYPHRVSSTWRDRVREQRFSSGRKGYAKVADEATETNRSITRNATLQASVDPDNADIKMH